MSEFSEEILVAILADEEEERALKVSENVEVEGKSTVFCFLDSVEEVELTTGIGSEVTHFEVEVS